MWNCYNYYYYDMYGCMHTYHLPNFTIYMYIIITKD